MPIIFLMNISSRSEVDCLCFYRMFAEMRVKMWNFNVKSLFLIASTTARVFSDISHVFYDGIFSENVKGDINNVVESLNAINNEIELLSPQKSPSS